MKLSAVALLASLTVFGASAKMVEVQHAQGITKLESNPERVVVIGLGALDTVKALGVEPVALSTVSMFPDYLAEYRDYQFVSAGSLHEPNFEVIYTQKPDLIIVGSRAAPKYKELSEIAPTIVYDIDSKQGYWASTKQQWRNLAKVFDKQEIIESKIEQVEQQINHIRTANQSKQLDALTVMSAGGNITTFGFQSRFSAIYSDFGFKETVEGIKESRHGDLVSYEFISQKNPSTLLVVDKDLLINKGKGSTVQRDFENELVKSTQAYQQKRLAYLDINAWYLSVAGIRATEQMIADVTSVSAAN
ncbi:siderophore ABC transporter substrate-binding protein [Vibrio sp. Hep-1b-8]|uniref:siderophore ABC transporter substrate-binding protein n=1 Tax=Vibrio sp. Hep-1b-8 TaxID=2144187 RepID=UPI0011106834|nr:siderophore ABC transporter substrate-binding protein [Vibrio sp. Hep-1b-8]TMX35834.1 siderophore ABC transporter substrate-binding protein [Vibrio sp. Hep-1b-8]